MNDKHNPLAYSNNFATVGISTPNRQLSQGDEAEDFDDLLNELNLPVLVVVVPQEK